MNVTSVFSCRTSTRRGLAPALCVAALLPTLLAAQSASPATPGPSLTTKLNGLAGSSPVGTVIITFNTNNGLNPTHLTTLSLAGVTRGYTLQSLGMVAAPATASQVRDLASSPAVRSIWLNDRLSFLNDQTRVLTGVDRMRSDPEFTRLHGGLPVSGK